MRDGLADHWQRMLRPYQRRVNQRRGSKAMYILQSESVRIFPVQSPTRPEADGIHSSASSFNYRTFVSTSASQAHAQGALVERRMLHRCGATF